VVLNLLHVEDIEVPTFRNYWRLAKGGNPTGTL